jgi:serine/threonine protein kinase
VGQTPDGVAYAVVDAFTGERLSQILAARGVLPLHEAVDLCLQAAAGLDAVHEAGLVHGNISPQTILVAHEAHGGPLVKLIGFSLGTIEPHPKARRPIGGVASGGYASPERLSGSPPDARSDVFSLGAVLHYLLTGAPPGKRSARKSIPKSVRAVVAQALAASPGDRFQTIAEFADALKHAVTVQRRAKRTAARRPLLLGTTAVSVLLAVGLWLAWNRGRALESAARGGRVTGVSAPAPSKPAAGRSAPSDTAPAGVRPGSARRVRPAQPGPAREPDSSVSASGAAPFTAERGEPDSGVALSPFRREHPWAAVPGGRFYFRSSCPLALRSRDLLYFRSEEEAQATGRSRSPASGCS